MKNKDFFLFISITLICLFPFVFAGFFALPFADDFCFGWSASEPGSILQKWTDQYLYWNGRFTSDILIQFHPLAYGSIFLYKVVVLSLIFATPIFIFVFVKSIAKIFEVGISESVIGVVALGYSLLYFQLLPQLVEGLYWFTGVVNYHLGSLATIIFLTSLANMYHPLAGVKWRNYISTVLLLIIATGFNELSAVIIPVICFLALWIGTKNRSSHFGFLATLLFISLLASAIVICSPGNFIRAATFTSTIPLWKSFILSIAQTVRFFLGFVFSPISFLLTFTLFANPVSLRTKGGNTIIYFVLSITLLFLAAFMPYSATGQLGQHRTYNFALFFFIGCWSMFLVELRQKICYKALFENYKIVTLKYLFVALLFLAFTFSGNSWKLWKDIASGAFQRYSLAYYSRENAMITNYSIPKKLSFIPPSLQITDVQEDTAYFADKCMMRYYESRKKRISR